MAWRGQAGKAGGQKGEKGNGKSANKWQYWSGSWSPARQGGGAPWRKGQGKGQENKNALNFPGYDSAQKEESHISEITSAKDTDGDSYANALQKAINQVRKAESRVRKAHSDQKARATQWNNWVMELRRTFAKEKSRFQSATSRLEREMEEALLEQEGARAGLRRVAASMEVDSLSRSSETVEVSAEFDAIMQEDWCLEEPQESNAEILRRTLQPGEGCQKEGAASAKLPELPATPPSKRLPAYSLEASTPLHGGKLVKQRVIQQPCTGSTSASPVQTPACSDPYMASPSTTARRASPAAGARRKITTPDGTGREGVKSAVKPTAPKHVASHSQTLADKLEARRQALIVRGPDVPITTPSMASGEPKAVVPPQHHLLYDDGEDEAPSEASDLEAWYNGKYGTQDLQSLE